MSDLHDPILGWYDEHARELPWRSPSAIGVVGDGLGVHAPADPGRPRVLPVHAEWLNRWPTPADLAAESTR